MRPSIPVLLAHIAAAVVVAPGCSSHGSCQEPQAPPTKTVAVTGDVACQLAHDQGVGQPSTVMTSSASCAAACNGDYSDCTLPDAYVQTYIGSTPALTCPTVSGMINVTCSAEPCLGRWTAGMETPRGAGAGVLSDGEYFARCAYFEAASVFAFERLATELTAHGAPSSLIRAARRAAKDEGRHARAMGLLARRFGVEPAPPGARDLTARPLLDVARENAVEGCVRETYGAVIGLVGATRAPDPEVRATMQSIARDECRHAALSWRVDAWAMSRLERTDREAVR
jgi:hypothetical protein